MKQSSQKSLVNSKNSGVLSFFVILFLSCAVLFSVFGCEKQAKTEKVSDKPIKSAPVKNTDNSSAGSAVKSSAKSTGTKTPGTVKVSVPDASRAAAKINSPRIVFEKMHYDFGEVGPRAKRIGEYKFTNKGNRDLKIIEVRTCCGVAPIFKKGPYKPGENGVIKIRFVSQDSLGVFSRHIYVLTNDKHQPRTELSLRAKIVPKMEYKPNFLRLFLNRKNAGCGDIMVRSLDGKPFAIKKISSTGDCIDVDYDPNVTASKFVLHPKVNIEKLRKRQDMRGRVEIDLTHPDCENINVLFDVIPEFTINPPQLIAFNVEPGKPIKRKIWIFGNYGKDFDIESVTSEKGSFKVLGQKKSEEMEKGISGEDEPVKLITCRLDLEITPGKAEPDNKVFSDILTIKIKQGGSVSIKFRGFYLQ